LKKQIIYVSDLIEKPTLISVVPDIDTRVCSIQTRTFNQKAGAIEGVNLVTISNNTREEQEDWCAAEGVKMEILHDTELSFAKNYGLYIPDMGHLARAIFVIDTKGYIAYEEIVPDIGDEPDYDAALAAVNAL
jgi:thiol peroxidase